jgi:hypothetical protein
MELELVEGTVVAEAISVNGAKAWLMLDGVF